MELKLKRRIIGGLIVAIVVSMTAAVTVRVTVELALLTLYFFAAMSALFLGMSLIHWYLETKDRMKLVLYGVSVFCFIGAIVPFELARDAMFPAPQELRTALEMGAGVLVACAWAAVAAWLLEAGIKRQEHADRQKRVEEQA